MPKMTIMATPQASLLKFSQDMVGKKPCLFFAQGICKNGAGCGYSHDSSACDAVKNEKLAFVCNHFLNGRCHFGNSCVYKHPVGGIKVMNASINQLASQPHTKAGVPIRGDEFLARARAKMAKAQAIANRIGKSPTPPRSLRKRSSTDTNSSYTSTTYTDSD